MLLIVFVYCVTIAIACMSPYLRIFIYPAEVFGEISLHQGLSTSQLQSSSSKIMLLPKINSFLKRRRENKESVILKEDFVKRFEKWNTHFDKHVWSEREYFEEIQMGLV